MNLPAAPFSFLRVFALSISLFSLNVYASSDAEHSDDDTDSAQSSSKARESQVAKNATNPNTKKLSMFQGPGAEPWVTDGTSEGTMMIDVYPGGTSFAYGFTRFKGEFYFQANNGTNGFELWKSDGTAAGTKLVKDINPGTGSSFHYRFAEFVAYQGALYFQANDGVNGFELWRTDGTEAGTNLVHDIHTMSQGASSTPGSFTVMNDILYFTADHGLGGRKLRKFNGTANSSLVNNNDVFAGTSAPDAVPASFPILNGELYMQARDPASNTGYELWKSNGTVAGTVLVKDINPAAGSSNPGGFKKLNNAIYFSAYDGVNGNELWKTDGTAVGTVMVKDIYPGAEGSRVVNLTRVKGTLYFQAFDPVYGYELWKTDGTEAGTLMVKDISIENGGRFSDYLFSQFVPFKGVLYFQTKDNVNGPRFWVTDGSAEGTVRVKDIRSAANFTVLTNALYFTASKGAEYGLWKSQGSPESTVLVKQF